MCQNKKTIYNYNYNTNTVNANIRKEISRKAQAKQILKSANKEGIQVCCRRRDRNAENQKERSESYLANEEIRTRGCSRKL